MLFRGIAGITVGIIAAATAAIPVAWAVPYGQGTYGCGEYSEGCGQAVTKETLYRLYNGRDHFYTTNSTERGLAMVGGYTAEGIAGYPAATAETGTNPIYRLYSTRTRDHFYTTDLSERNFAIANVGYVDEGTVGYAYTSSPPGGTGLFYRLYLDPTSDHFYTMSASEATSAIIARYRSEGSIGNIYTSL